MLKLEYLFLEKVICRKNKYATNSIIQIKKTCRDSPQTENNIPADYTSDS